MKCLTFVFFVLATPATWACADFSGVYFDDDGSTCLVTLQTGCGRLQQTSYFKTAPPLTVDYITDGQLRRYPVEWSMQKAIYFDQQGRQVFLGLHDNYDRIDGLYEKLADGNIHMSTKWTGADGETAEFESLLVQMPSLESCLKRL